MKHYADDELTLYYYGESRRPAEIEKHLGECAGCAATYRSIAGTLSLVAPPDLPERGDLYGLEVWQRIRHQLPPQDSSWFSWNRLAIVATAAALSIVVAIGFLAGRMWPGHPPAASQVASESPGVATDARQRILAASIADHLDRSDRVLTEIMNAPAGRDITAEQRWADDLVSATRLYRQDAVAAGDQSVANVLDELERSLMEIVHSPAHVSAEDLEQIRRRIDAAALVFKIRVLQDQLRGRETAHPQPRKTT